MAILDSSNIYIFPAAGRDSQQYGSRLTSEAHLVSIVNRLIGKTGFVISQQTINSSTAAGTLFEFNIHGYLVAVDAKALYDKITSFTDVYAKIVLDVPESQEWDFTELIGADEVPLGGSVPQYSGVDFVGTEGSEANTYYLHILTKSGSDFIVPEESLIRFDSNILGAIIDDGIIS